jgi:hypothetical protein
LLTTAQDSTAEIVVDPAPQPMSIDTNLVLDERIETETRGGALAPRHQALIDMFLDRMVVPRPALP